MILEAKNISVGYDAWPVLEEIDFSVEQRKIVAIVGANAAGKTTLFRGLMHHGAWLRGDLCWEGHSVPHLDVPHVRTTWRTWVRQDRPWFAGFTLRDTLRLVLDAGSRQAEEAAIEAVVDLVPDVSPYLDQAVETLSGGQRAMAAVATGLAPRPKLVLMDEPAANLDTAATGRLGRILRRYVDETGAGCLLIEHRKAFLEDVDVTVPI